MDGASGEAGDRRLSSKQKSKSFDVPPAVADGGPEADGEEPPAPPAAPPAAPAQGPATASETPPTPQPPAGERPGGGRR